jgi:hypothetical protein
VLQKRLALFLAMIAVGIVACNGSGGVTTSSAPVAAASAASSGTTIASSGSTVQAAGVTGITSFVTVAGTGAVTAAESVTPPSGMIALQSVARQTSGTVKPAATANIPLLYITLTATTATTVSGLPAVVASFTTAPTGQLFLAYFSNTAWVTLAGPGTVSTTSSGPTVTFAASTLNPALSIPAGSSLVLAVYSGAALATPTPIPSPTSTAVSSPAASPSPVVSASPTSTPSPAGTTSPTPSPTPTNVIRDSGFEVEGAAGALSGNATTGWQACSYAHPSRQAPSTPVPAATLIPAVPSPGAILVSTATASFNVGPTPNPTHVPAITSTPLPIAPTANTGTFAALTFTGTGADTTFFTAIKATNGICQTFVVPQNGVLTLFVNEGGNESGLGFADQEATIFVGGISALAAASPAPISVFQELNTQFPTPAPTGTPAPAGIGTWVQRGPFNLTQAPYNLTAGQTVTLFLGTFDESPSVNGFGEYMFVDDVTVVGIPVSASSVKRAPLMQQRLRIK